MKKILLVTILITVSLLLLWLLKREATEPQKTTPVTAHSEAEPTKKAQKDLEDKRAKQLKERHLKMKRLVAEKNVLIEFWGEVVDHLGKPLEGVSIRYRVSQPRIIWDSNTVVKTTTTGKNGDFYIKENGSDLSLEELKKNNYLPTEGQQRGFAYGYSSEKYIANKNKPRVYTMIKREILPDLIVKRSRLTLAWDGKPVRYDIKSGKLTKDGEIKITAWRGIIDETGYKFPWSIKLEVIGGGVQQIDKAQTHLALINGYQKDWEFKTDTSNKWQAGISHSGTYIGCKFKDGTFGYITLDVTPSPRNKKNITIEILRNPSGGRILYNEK